MPINTPSYAVRLETVSSCLSLKVLSFTLSLIFRISLIDKTRLSRRCYEVLRDLAISNPSFRSNWLLQLYHNFGLNNEENIWENLSLDHINQRRDSLLERYGGRLRAIDLEKHSRSCSLLIYSSLPISTLDVRGVKI